MARALLLAAMSAAVACGGHITHAPAPPPGGYTAPVVPETATSSIRVTTRTDIGPMVALIKAAAPRPLAQGTRVVDLMNRRIAKLSAHARYEVHLADVALHLDGARATAVATVDFRLHVRAKGRGLGGLVSVSAGVTNCGYNEPMPRVRFSLSGTLRVAPGPRLQFSPGGWRTEWLRPCRLGMGLQLEHLLELSTIKRRVNDAIAHALSQAPKHLDLAGKLARLRERLTGSHPAGDNVRLHIRPQSVTVADIRGTGTVLRAQVRARVQLHATTTLAYPAIAAHLHRRYRQQLGERWTIAGVRSYAAGGRLVIAVELTAPVATTVYFVGAPTDAPSHTHLRMRDGALTAASKRSLGARASAFETALRDATAVKLPAPAARPIDLGNGARAVIEVDRLGPSHIALTEQAVVVTTAIRARP